MLSNLASVGGHNVCRLAPAPLLQLCQLPVSQFKLGVLASLLLALLLTVSVRLNITSSSTLPLVKILQYPAITYSA